MSLINTYRTTLKTLFGSDGVKAVDKKIIITTEFGIELIKNSLSATELFEMEIIGIFLLGDNGIFSNSQLNIYKLIFFVEDEKNITDISIALNMCKTNVDIHFYTPIEKNMAEKILLFDTDNKTQKITSSSLSMIPVGNHCMINNKTTVLSTIKFRPSHITIYQSTQSTQSTQSDQLEYLNLKINECANLCTIYEKEDIDNILLIGLERSYDTLVHMLIPWHYESMLHFHNIKLPNQYDHLNDNFYRTNAYNIYGDVLENMKNQIDLNKKHDKKKNSTALEILENEKMNKIIIKHYNTLNKLSEYIKNENILKKSEQEQKAIMRKLTEKELNEFKLERPQLVDAIYQSKEQKERFGSIIYDNYQPKIKLLIEKYIKEYPNIKQFYFYIKDFICYEEVCQVELFNNELLKKNSNIRIYLISDNITNHWSYLANLFTQNVNSSKNIFRINTLYISQNNNTTTDNIDLMNNPFGDVENKITELENTHIVTFDDNQEHKRKILKQQISKILISEYEKQKNIKTMNKIQENNKNINIMKLNKLTTRFKLIEEKEKKHKNTNIDYFKKTNQFYPLDEIDEVDETYQSKPTYDTDSNNFATKQFDMSRIEHFLDDRKNAILQITEGVQDIHKLSLELSLITEQTSLKLDEIEVSLLKSVDMVSKGAEELDNADSMHSKSMGIQQKITLALTLIATGLMTGTIFKFSHN